MSRSTRAVIELAKSGIAFTIRTYDYAPGAGRVGLQAADALGEAPSRVLKTLMIEVDGMPACAIIPSDRELALKKVAGALGGKAARMMPPRSTNLMCSSTAVSAGCRCGSIRRTQRRG